MLLQRLVEHSRRPDVGIAPTMYSLESLRYWIELDDDGAFRGLITVESETGKRPPRVEIPTLVRSSAVRSKLLADNAEYVLGVGRPNSKRSRVDACHDAFVTLVRNCWEATRTPSVSAVLHFLEDLDVSALTLPPDFDPAATISFRVGDVRPIDLPAVQSFWAGCATEGKEFQCLVCGRRRPAVERLQIRLKGIPGGQTAGLALISANADAFESYGLEASYIAPTCQDCSDRFMKAANGLIRGENTHLRIGSAMYIFWTREPAAFSVLDFLSKPDPNGVRELLRAARTGRPTTPQSNRFYATSFTASGARVAIRDWIDTTVDQAQDNLARFFTLQRIIEPWESEPPPLSIFGLARSTVRSGSRDDPAPWITTALMHFALSGGPLPSSLLFKAVNRCRLEHGVTHNRAALIKMVFLSRLRGSEGEDYMVELDTENREPAYLCGRLFAELEAVQRAALGDVGASIVDRFYGTASSAPATVFGRLVRGAQPHLAKLRRDRRGAYFALDVRLQDILAGLNTFSATLNLEKQGFFALGYYHQRAADRLAAKRHGLSEANAPDLDIDQTEAVE